MRVASPMARLASAAIAGLVGWLSSAVADEPIRFRLIAQDRGKVAIISADGKVEWEHPCRHAAHDLTLLPNGNLLLNSGPATVEEITPEHKTVWKYTAKPTAGVKAVEVHACQRLADGSTLVAESGNKRLVEVAADGTVTKTIPLTVDKPNAHRDTRLARKLDNGHYLVCHEGDGTVREYDADGKVVWSYKLELGGRARSNGHGPEGHGTEVFSALRLPNGNTLIGGGNNNRVLEVNAAGEIVWSIDQKELPGVTLAWVSMVQVLPDGRILIGNCHAGPDNPQLILVNREKKVLWTFQDHKTFGNSLVVAQLLDVKGTVLR